MSTSEPGLPSSSIDFPIINFNVHRHGSELASSYYVISPEMGTFKHDIVTQGVRSVIDSSIPGEGQGCPDASDTEMWTQVLHTANHTLSKSVEDLINVDGVLHVIRLHLLDKSDWSLPYKDWDRGSK